MLVRALRASVVWPSPGLLTPPPLRVCLALLPPLQQCSSPPELEEQQPLQTPRQRQQRRLLALSLSLVLPLLLLPPPVRRPQKRPSRPITLLRCLDQLLIA